MQLFPYILIREAGIPTDLLLNLPSVEEKSIQAYIALTKKKFTQSQTLLAEIETHLTNSNSSEFPTYLINLKHQLLHKKKLRDKDIHKIGSNSDYKNLLQNISTYQEAVAAKNKMESDFEKIIETSQIETASYLFQNKENFELLNGVFFSSPQFYKQLQERNFDPEKFNKKIRQTVSKLLEYISRASYKTSPFSSFCKIGFWNLDKSKAIPPTNNFVLYFDQVELKAPTNEAICLNQTIFENQDFYYFFSKNDGGEMLERIQKKPVIVQLVENFRVNKTNELKLSQLNEFEQLDIQSLIKDQFLIKKTIAEPNFFMIDDRLNEDLNKKEKAVNEIREKIALEINEKPTLYEDCFAKVEAKIEKSKIESITDELNQLTKILAPLHFFEMREKIKQSCKENLDNEEAINLVELITEINTLPENYLATNILEEKETRTIFKDKLESKLKNKNGVVTLSFEDFNFAKKSTETNYFAAHVQISNNQNTKSIVNDISNGAGKLFSRFALQQEEFSTALKNYIYKQEGDEILVLNQDHSTNQVNMHPELIDKKIALPDSYEKGISPGNLFVTYQSDVDKIFLINKNSEVIKIINLGVESETTRSYFYPYLSAFTGSRVALRPLLEIINICTAENRDKVHILPRIELGKQLILQRKSWHFPIGLVPQLQKGETNASYFMRLHIWIAKNNLPNKVFIKRQSDWYGAKTERTSSDLHKPQFIDFTNISFVLLFNKQLKDVIDFLQVTEVLPAIEHQENFKVKEYAVEWFG